MRTFFLYYLLSRLFSNPLLALLVVAALYVVADRRLIGLLPDVARPFRRASQVRQLKEAIDLNPADAKAQLELGSLFFAAGQPQKAIPYLERAAMKLGDHAHAQFYLGAAYVKEGRPAAGRQALQRAVALRPEVQYGLPYVYIAESLLQPDAKEGHQPAEGRLHELAGHVLHYGNVETLYRMGAVLLQGGYRQEAVRLFHEAQSSYRQGPAFARRAARRFALLARLRLYQLRG